MGVVSFCSLDLESQNKTSLFRVDILSEAKMTLSDKNSKSKPP